MRKDINTNISTSLRFRNKRQKKEKSGRRLLVLFLAAVLAVAVVSAVVLLHEGGLGIADPVETEQTTLEPTLPVSDTLSGRINFLLVCTDDSGASLRYAGLLSADMNTASLNLCMLPENAVSAFNSYAGTFTEHFTYGGMAQLVGAVEEYAQVGVERYIRATDSGFKNAVKLFAGLEYEVPETVECVISGVSFTIVGGKQTLTPDMLERYMIYLSDEAEGDQGELERLLCALIDGTVTAQNVQKGESLFRKLANYFETDISIMDYTSAAQALEAYVNDMRRTPVAAVDGFESF